MWLNVDFDRREYSCRLHKDNCRFIQRKPTLYKGIGELKRDGGWLHFETVEKAKTWHKNRYPQIPWKPCKTCFGQTLLGLFSKEVERDLHACVWLK